MKYLLSVVFTCLALVVATVHAQPKKKVHVIEISGEVDLGMASYVEHATRDAVKEHAVILLHVNTFGGRVDAATRIRDAIISANVPTTIAFIDSRAISAGALISLAAKKIIMSPAATIGASTPVDGSGTKAPEKYISYMRAEMKSTAEKNGRNGRVVEAMVDESLGLDTIAGFHLDKGKLLTLTTKDALLLKIADSTATTLEEALNECEIHNAEIMSVPESVGDKLVRFLTLPFLSSLLIMIGLAGLFYSIKTGHFGLITLLAIASLALFFGGQYIAEVASSMAIILFIAGVILFMLELTPIPTLGAGAVLGVIGMFLGVFLALAGDVSTLSPERMKETTVTLATAMVGILILVAIIFKFAPGWPWLKKFSNQTVSGNINHLIAEKKLLIGKEGTALTPLRPAGTALIDGKKVDVVTLGEFVLPGTNIIVTDTPANKVVVKSMGVIPV
ncbi:MAG: NfeD family protein [bacterium]